MIGQQYSRIVDYVNRSNPSYDLPYHNTRHLMFVAEMCDQGATYHNIAEDDHHGVVIAALMHDFDHKGGVQHDDSKNIRQAIDGLSDVAIDDETSLPFSDNVYHIAHDCIVATQYPYIVDETSIVQCIIRDADLMTIYDVDHAVDQMQGLYIEMCMFNRRVIPQQKFVEDFIKFQRAIKWRTQWAKEKAADNDFDNLIIATADKLFK